MKYEGILNRFDLNQSIAALQTPGAPAPGAGNMPFDILYIGELKEVFTEEKYLTDNVVDITKVNPFTLSMPDNTYWSVGEKLGKAWNIGKRLKK